MIFELSYTGTQIFIFPYKVRRICKRNIITIKGGYGVISDRYRSGIIWKELCYTYI